MYPVVKSFAKENPTMILTLCYVLITAIGTGYSFYFYREFDINIIKFADLSDFLLAAILEPRSLLMFGFAVLLLLVAYWSDMLMRRRFKWYQNFVQNRLKAKYTDPIVLMIVVLSCTVVLMQDLAEKNAAKIKSQSQDSYQVMYAENGVDNTVKSLELLGSTSRFVYFYDHKSKQSVVISPENVSYMKKVVSEKKAVKEAVVPIKKPDVKQEQAEKAVQTEVQKTNL